MKRVWLWLVVILVLAVPAGVGLSSGATGYNGRLAAEPLPEGREALPDGARVETVLSGMVLPVALAFDPDGRLFYTEKSGAVRLVVNGELRGRPVMEFDVDSSGERGLLGITLDPNFSSNRYVYVYYTEMPAGGRGDRVNKVVRLTESDGVGSNPTEIFSSPDSAGTTNHNGGNIHFGPDGKLYISVGDDARADTAQDLTARNGKLHRVNPDGGAPDDNPDFGREALPSIFARGLRNSFDFAFDPRNGTVWASENGPSCDDELNRIVPGGNYGWRANYPCESHSPNPNFNTNPPLWYLRQEPCCIAPTGVEFYRGGRLAGWDGTLLMCDFRDGRMRHFYLDEARTGVSRVAIVEGVQCNMDVQTGPDGALYYLQGGGYSPGTLKRITGPAPANPTATSAPAATPTTPAPRPTQTGRLIDAAHDLFYQVWERVDRPVKELRADRSWTWGPVAGRSLEEPYGEGSRLVQYFDKARMELNPAAGGNQAYVTNGLLVVEMIGGQVQVGPQSYEARPPATVPIGGDGPDNPAPSYAALAGVASLAGQNQAQDRIGQPVTATLDREGRAGEGGPASAVRIAAFATETGHNIPDVFWNFLNQQGTVYQDGRYQEAKILDWVFTVGYPLTEPYWTSMSIGNRVQNVLVQAYQRQVLTYIPGYEAPWHVQFGNVGHHYHEWRYNSPP